VLKDNVVIEAGVFIGSDVEIGEGTRLFPNVVIYHGVRVGSSCRVHANSTIGADGFGFARSPQGWERIAQLGGVVIGDRVDIGANTTVDRGALGNTILAPGVILDDQVHIGHNCEIGENTAIAGCVGIAGSTKIGANCTLAGQVGVAGHICICDDVHITGQGRVLRSINKSGTYSSGTHLSNHRTWARLGARFDQLEELNRRMTALEKKFEI
jgi:UDP-3-O-[3-hydroxymyristoyl] glucosamine N-acyltransferase